MATLSKEQEHGAAAAAEESKKAFRRAQRLPKGPGRLEAFADQAETYLRRIDRLGIPHNHPMVANLVRMAEGNIKDWENYTTPGPVSPPPRVPAEPLRACFAPGCPYVGPPGTCPTHDQST